MKTTTATKMGCLLLFVLAGFSLVSPRAYCEDCQPVHGNVTYSCTPLPMINEDPNASNECGCEDHRDGPSDASASFTRINGCPAPYNPDYSVSGEVWSSCSDISLDAWTLDGPY